MNRIKIIGFHASATLSTVHVSFNVTCIHVIKLGLRSVDPFILAGIRFTLSESSGDAFHRAWARGRSIREVQRCNGRESEPRVTRS